MLGYIDANLCYLHPRVIPQKSWSLELQATFVSFTDWNEQILFTFLFPMFVGIRHFCRQSVHVCLLGFRILGLGSHSLESYAMPLCLQHQVRMFDGHITIDIVVYDAALRSHHSLFIF